MRKMLKSRKLNALLALSLSASLAAFGCTTNRTPGEGTPVLTSPSYAPAATSGTSSGAVQQYPPPMTSSVTTYDEPLPAAQPVRTGKLGLTADQAAAIMGQTQTGRGKFLGYANPGMSGRAYFSDQPQTSVVANPVVIGPSINSSINSPGGIVAITSGAGGAAATTAVTSGVTSAATSAPAAVFPSGTVGLTPTTAGIAVSPGAVAGTAPSPTLTSTAVTPVAAATSGTTATTITGTNAARSATTAATTAAATSAATSGTAQGAVRLLRSNGRTTVTNQQ